MNINYKTPSIRDSVTLNESQDISTTQFAEINSHDSADVEMYQKLLTDSNNLFKFSNGKSMAKFNAKIDVDSKFSLKWHAENTQDINEFFESIEAFLGTELADSDKSKLAKDYNRLYSEF